MIVLYAYIPYIWSLFPGTYIVLVCISFELSGEAEGYPKDAVEQLHQPLRVCHLSKQFICQL